MSEPYLSTRSKTCMQLIFKVFSSFRRPATHFMHAQGHQKACALTSCTNNFENTSVTVYELVHQKTVNIKTGKPTIWLSEVIRDFYHYFQEKKTGRNKKIESKVALQS